MLYTAELYAQHLEWSVLGLQSAVALRPLLPVAEMVPNDIQSELKHLYVAVGELLRHFWSCFPVNTPFLEEKVRSDCKYSQLL